MIHVGDARNWNRLVAHIDSEDYSDDVYDQGIDGENNLHFSLSIDHSAAPYLTDMCRLFRRNRRGFWQEYVAWKITKRSGGRITVLATGAEQEIDSLKIMHSGTYNAATLEQMAGIVLANTGWQLGRVEYADFQTESIERPVGGYAFLRRLCNYFNRELRARVEVSGTRVLGRYIDLVKRVGQDNRAVVSFGDNLTDLERIVHTDRIVTRLECEGPLRADGTRLTAIVTDEDAFNRWNLNGRHRVAYYEPDSADEEMTEPRLEQLGRMELNKRINSVVEYNISVAVLPEDDYALGDSLRIEDRSFNPPLFAESRIIHESGPIDFTNDDVTEIEYKIGQVIELDLREGPTVAQYTALKQENEVMQAVLMEMAMNTIE